MAVSKTIPRGTLLSGKYRIERELGRGGMASVYEAVHADMGKRVAIKLLAGHLTAAPTLVERFLREARVVASVRSPYICDIYDVDRLEDGTPFLVLELLEGELLYDRMVRDGQLSMELTLAIILQACRGLGTAHEARIVHRDLKPENLFLTGDADGRLLVKILDFGLAKFHEPAQAGQGEKARLTRAGALFGTPAYMSPEQVGRQGEADHRADLWALGCITYECLTGKTVWSLDEGVAMTLAHVARSPLPLPSALRPKLPAGFDAWFQRALDRNIDRRFQSAAELGKALVHALGYAKDGRGVDAVLKRLLGSVPPLGTVARTAGGAPLSLSSREPPPSSRRAEADRPSPTAAQPAAPPRRKGPWMGLVAALLLLAAVVAALFFWRARTEKPQPVALARVGSAVRALARAEPEPRSAVRFVARLPWLRQVRQAQELVAEGEPERALAVLRSAYDRSRHGMVRNLLEQVQVALVARSMGAPCEVTGYARPRRVDLADPSRGALRADAPTVAYGPAGPVVTWVDTRDGHARAYAAALDDRLRNRAMEADISPEAGRSHVPVLLPADGRLLATYRDSSGSLPGVYLRWLSAEAVIAGPPVLAAKQSPGRGTATATPIGEERWLVAWTARSEPDSVDLYYQVFGADGDSLGPRGAPVRLTDYVFRGRARGEVRALAAAAVEGRFHFAYALAREPHWQIRYQSVAADAQPPGLEPADAAAPGDRTLTEELEVSPTNMRAVAPSLGCTRAGCFVAWHDALGAGAGVAFIDAPSGKLQWHKRFALRGGHPTIGVASGGELRLVWNENGRVITASLGREGIGPQSRIARVVGEQPAPSVAAGSEPGEWTIAWRDFEAGHLEPYVARIRCP